MHAFTAVNKTFAGGPGYVPIVTPSPVTLAKLTLQTFTAFRFYGSAVTWTVSTGTVLGGTATTLVWRSANFSGDATITANGVFDPFQSASAIVHVTD